MQTYTIKVLTDDDVLSGEDVAQQVEQIPEVTDAVLVRVEVGDTLTATARERVAKRLDEADWPSVAEDVRAGGSARRILGDLSRLGEGESEAARIICDWIKEGGL